MHRSAAVRFFATLALGLLLAACGGTANHDWALESLDGAELEVVVAVGSSSCNTFERLDVFEGPRSVRINAIVNIPRGLSGDCTTDLVTQRVSVTLAEPLGDRTLTGCHIGSTFDSGLWGEPRQTCADVLEHLPQQNEGS